MPETIEVQEAAQPPVVERVSHRGRGDSDTALCGAPFQLRTHERPADRPICPTCDLLAAWLDWTDNG